MALPAYDPLKHHIGLGPVGSTSLGFILTGAYRTDPQRLGGSTEYGGEDDVLTAGTLARWSQDDFSGGGFQEDAQSDPAMFFDSKSLIPNLVERTARTCPPLVFFADAGVLDASASLGVFSTGGTKIAVVGVDKIDFYDAVSGIPRQITTDDADSTLLDPKAEIFAAVHDPADNLVYLVCKRTDITEPSNQLNGSITAGANELTMDSNTGFPTNGVVTIGNETIYYRGKSGGNKLLDLQRGREGTTAESHADNANVNFRRQFFLAKMEPVAGTSLEWIGWIPNSAAGPPRGICVTAGRDILVQMDKALWLLDVNDERDSLTAVRIGRLPGRWQDAVTYNGQTYILLTDSEQFTQVVSWDGTQVLPVTGIPYNFLGSAVVEYAGRIYVSGRGADITGADRYAELYEISGASLKLLKSFSSEARAGQTVPTNFPAMVVHEGLLWLATDIGELVAYDVTRDAFWPGIQLYHPDSHVLQARFLLSTREKLVAWCFDTDVTSPDHGFYRLATDDADLESVFHTQFLETSDFMPQPDRDKRWSTVRLVTRYDNCSLEVSQDSGSTWAGVAGTIIEDGTKLKIVDYDLSALDPSPSIRFRWTMGSSTVAYKEFVAFTCSFLWLDSGKFTWSTTVLGAEMPENLDGVAREQDVAALRSTLRGYVRDKTTLTLTDLDGEQYTVYVSEFSEVQPQIAQAVDENGTREALYSLVLTEI